MDAKQTILQVKYARIIKDLADKLGISFEKAMEDFYHSDTFQMLQNGIADLHCRSDKYIVDEYCLEKEGRDNQNKNTTKN